MMDPDPTPGWVIRLFQSKLLRRVPDRFYYWLLDKLTANDGFRPLSMREFERSIQRCSWLQRVRLRHHRRKDGGHKLRINPNISVGLGDTSRGILVVCQTCSPERVWAW